ncbi:MAG: ABC transporter substrate-binding protein [Gemmatimonadota bacterium]|nr:MAG: ABC transporter substrate-binding protein [Gemmatimonadota bacterium]
MPTIHLAHSPDSDDAFMFYALAAQKIPTGDREYVHELADIESLNRRAMNGELDVTAVSIHAYAYLADTYALLPHGSSMGDRYGPRVVSRDAAPQDVNSALRGRAVALPGDMTTASLAFKLFQADFTPVIMPFDTIERAVADREVDAGVLIHEGQLTYADSGLHLWLDLGEWWFGETGLPLPLGGNAIRRDLGDSLIREVSRDLRASIVYGLEHRAEALEHAMQYARDLDADKADEFVGMYVNDYTVDYGEKGRLAVQELLNRGCAAGIIPHPVAVTFVDDGSMP